MLIKIKGLNQRRFDENVTRIMNLACVAFRRGNIPTELDMQEPERTGQYWYENTKDNNFDLLPTTNNHKAFIRERGENFVIVEFYSRYDREGKQVNALCHLILSFFNEDEVEGINIPNNSNTLFNKYLLARMLAGYTQEELAKKAHLSDKTILTLEKGGKMSRNTLEKIERVLGEELKKVESIK